MSVTGCSDAGARAEIKTDVSILMVVQIRNNQAEFV